jgi:hypothetical protein
LTSFDNFVGEDGMTTSSSGSAGTTSSGGGTSGQASSSGGTTSSGVTSSSGTSSSSSGTSSGDVDAGSDGATPQCTIKSTGLKNGSATAMLGGGPNWATSNNALTADGLSASSTLNQSDSDSATLLVTGFNFGVPASASIRGVRMTVLRRVTPQADIRDENVRLTINGNAIGSDRNNGDTFPSNAFGTATYGSATDRWGLGDGSLSAAEVNAASFGAAFSTGHHGGVEAAGQIDEIKLEVTYCSVP